MPMPSLGSSLVLPEALFFRDQCSLNSLTGQREVLESEALEFKSSAFCLDQLGQVFLGI